jgi:chlorobactene glucosyltransferase
VTADLLARLSPLDLLGATGPWVLLPAVLLLRGFRSRSLDDYPEAAGDDAPRVTVIVPARDEARSIGRCVRSILDNRYPHLELIVVDDHSTDGTAEVARAAAAGDPRLTIVANPDLPSDWFGKQWACATGAAAARGEILAFVDADTSLAPDLVPRTVSAMLARGADLLSVAGRQELGSFWERVVQPQVFAVLLARYGGTERVSRARRPIDKIANGQCLFVRREAYDAAGGHAAVRHNVAEDLKLAQHMAALGRPVHLVLGTAQLSTRMYTSLRELVRGWRKNVFAGGRESMPFGALGRLVFPLFLVLPPLYWLFPPVALVLGLLGVGGPLLLATGLVATVASLAWWILVYVAIGESPLYALTWPLGALVMLGISLQAIARGSNVQWKGRAYVSRGGAADQATNAR